MSGGPSPRAWAGCHGVRVDGAPFDLGESSGAPLSTASLQIGTIPPSAGAPLWTQHGEAFVDDELVAVDRTLARRDDGTLVLSANHGPIVEVDPTTRTITVGEGRRSVQRQLLASFALPLILHRTDALLVHGSAFARGDHAVVVCGDSGAGKSSALIRMIDEGWDAVSEDVCTIDLRDGTARVWPGPPWVRAPIGEPGPAGCAAAFRAGDKTAWDTSGMHAKEARAVGQLVLLDPPHHGPHEEAAVAVPDAIRALARHAVWLEEQDERGPRLFERVARLTSGVPATRLRLSLQSAWRDSLAESLAAMA